MSPQSPGACPLPSTSPDRITLMHGEGGRVMRRLIGERIVAKLAPGSVQQEADAADIGRLAGNIAVTTDSYVVSPLFFPGGDIGSLAVFGTVNDLAMSGARPLFLTLSLIIEEGLLFDTLDRVIDSVARSAECCEVKIVAGDTKVVPKGAADGLFINTAGVGLLPDPPIGGAASIAAGDRLIVSRSIAEHGLAVLSARESLDFIPPPRTDSAPLHHVAERTRQLLGNDLRAMRDATRGGVAAVLHEWAEASGQAMWIDDAAVPLSSASRGICEMLGLDPLFIANEGTFLMAVAPHRTDAALGVLREFDACDGCAAIGEVVPRKVSPVVVRRGIGIDQPLDEPVAAMLPRIC